MNVPAGTLQYSIGAGDGQWVYEHQSWVKLANCRARNGSIKVDTSQCHIIINVFFLHFTMHAQCTTSSVYSFKFHKLSIFAFKSSKVSKVNIGFSHNVDIGQKSAS